MPQTPGSSDARREAIRIQPWARWLSGLLGMAGVASGGVAVFITHVEAGPVALIAGGILFLLLALSGVMPTRLKIGDTDAEWQRLIEDRIEQKAPEVAALLDSGGASLEAIVSGLPPEPTPDLMRAGVKAGSLAEDVRLLEEKAGAVTVPVEALLQLGRWYMAQEDWAQAAHYLDAYVSHAQADWQAYYALGVANANRRGGEEVDRKALRAYDEALMRMPPDAPTNLAARLYSYRAGMKKRLGRFREAKADAEIAKELAESRPEQIDAIYNLAGIEAMLGNRDAALGHIADLNRLGATQLVCGHLNDYFGSLLDDPEFQRLVGLIKSPAN